MPSARVSKNPLAAYHRKRDFEITSEPHGGDAAHTTGDRFVIQCHAASRLHHDFRLELDGLLLSWSVLGRAQDFARAIADADAMVRFDPGGFVATATKAARRGKIFIDGLRNGRGATFITPYSMRARAGAPVASPISCEELPTVDPGRFTIATVPDSRPREADPWAAMASTRQSLRSSALARLVRVSQG